MTLGRILGAAVLTLALQTPAAADRGAAVPSGSAVAVLSTDINGDGFVDVADFNIFRREFLQIAPCCDGTYNVDFNCDGKVDGLDFNTFRQSFVQRIAFGFVCP